MLRQSINLIAAGMVSVGLYSAFPTNVAPVGPVAVLLHSTALADVPNHINHQGVVSVNGVRFSGTGLFRFAIVDAAGQNVWTNDGSSVGSPDVPISGVARSVVNGAYNIRLGDATLPNMIAIPPTVFALPDRSLRIWFDSQQGHGLQRLIPDQPLASAAYALRAAGIAGEMRMWAGSVASVPEGWLFCDGRAVDRAGPTGYPSLFAAIGTNHGQGNGTTTFNLPDMRNRVPMGVHSDISGLPRTTVEVGVDFGDMITHGPSQSGGSATHILTTAQIPAHFHSGTTAGGNRMAYRVVGNGDDPALSRSTTQVRGYQAGSPFVDRDDDDWTMRNHTHDFETDTDGGGGLPHSNLDPYLAVAYIICSGR